MTGKHEGRLVEGHDGETKGEHKEEHEGKHEEKHKGKHKGKHEGEHEEETWRPFDFGRESWRENMVESHEGEPCRLFDQAIYTYLISCRVGSGFRVGLSGQASQPDPSARVQLLNPTRHFSKKIPTRPDTFRVGYPTRRGQSMQNQLSQIEVAENARKVCKKQSDKILKIEDILYIKDA